MALRDDTVQKFRHRRGGEGTLLVSGTTANDASGNPRWSLYALDTKKGKQRWVLDLPDVPGRMVQANGIAYLVYGTSSIMAVNTESGLMIWQQQIPAPEAIADLALLSGRLYVTTVSGSILRFSWDGTLRSTIAPPAGYTFGSPVVDENIMIVVGTRTDRTRSFASPYTLAAFDIMHGDVLLWARGFSGKVGDPVVRDLSLIVTIPDSLSTDSIYDQYCPGAPRSQIGQNALDLCVHQPRLRRNDDDDRAAADGGRLQRGECALWIRRRIRPAFVGNGENAHLAYHRGR